MEKIIRLIDNRFGPRWGEIAVYLFPSAVVIAVIALERFAFWWFG